MRNYTVALFLCLVCLSPLGFSKLVVHGMTDSQIDDVLNDNDFYIFEPPIVSNLRMDGEKHQYVYLFFALEASGDQTLIDHHESLIRDRVSQLLKRKTFNYMATMRGRRLTMYEILKLIQQILWEEEGDAVVTRLKIIDLRLED